MLDAALVWKYIVPKTASLALVKESFLASIMRALSLGICPATYLYPYIKVCRYICVAGLLPNGSNGIYQGRVYVEAGGLISIPMGYGGLIMVNANVLTSVISAAIVSTSGSFTAIHEYKTSFGSESGLLSVLYSNENIVIKNSTGSDTFVLYKYIMVLNK